MRRVHQFTLGEWLQLLPVQQGLKQLRNDALLARYLQLRPPALAPYLSAHGHLSGRDVAVVIAFEQPWSLDWLLSAASRHLPDTTLLVFDNSRNERERLQIQAVCKRHGIPYLGLPPYRTRHVNRSHGVAMSWVFHNVLVPLAPRSFGFLDHDLIPVKRVRPQQMLEQQPVYGMLNDGNHDHWSLWAGYCWFDGLAVAHRPLNFLYDFSRGLDTGGRNWAPLYQTLDRRGLRFAPQTFLPLQLPGGESRQVEIVDDSWVHMGAISYNNNLEHKFAFFAELRRLLEQGTPLDELLCATA